MAFVPALSSMAGIGKDRCNTVGSSYSSNGAAAGGDGHGDSLETAGRDPATGIAT